MRHIKQRLAVLLAAMLMFPAQPAMAAESLPSELQGSVFETSSLNEEVMTEEKTGDDTGGAEESPAAGEEDEADGEEVTVGEEDDPAEAEENEIVDEDMITEDEIADEEIADDEITEEEKETEKDETLDEEEDFDEEELLDDSFEATPSNALTKTPEEEVIFNTGTNEFSVVSYEDFLDYELGDAYFEEDGSYTIHIPEENPFFPYEVQFMNNGKVTREWFMTPDDSVEVGGHTFYVSAYFDGTVVTQMTLDIAGEPVVVYPEKKEFTDGGGAVTMSLLPLEERNLTVDVSAYTPVELTRVAIDSIFAGEQELEDTDKIIWTARWDDSYEVSSSGNLVDLSYGTYNDNSEWEMIVGEDDQLADTNIRYFVSLATQKTRNWLIPKVYKSEGEGKRSEIRVLDSEYYDYYNRIDHEDGGDRELEIDVPSDAFSNQDQVFVSLSVNPDVFGSPQYGQLKIYEGKYQSEREAEGGVEITDRILDVDLSAEDTGYVISADEENWITLLTFDPDGKATGCLPIFLGIYRMKTDSHLSYSMSAKTGDNSWRNVISSTSSYYRNGSYNVTLKLYGGYPADGLYYLGMQYYDTYNSQDNSKVTAAYIGKYSSIAEAAETGAEDIKSTLFVSYSQGGCAADYSQGVDFTVFAGEDGSAEQKVFYCNVKTEEGTTPLSGSTYVYFYGIRDQDGNDIKSYVVDSDEDSYAENNYLTILVDETVDLTSLAPEFSTANGIHLYASGSSSPEISGESVHDFSDGPVQYTASAENGIGAKNYWLQIVKATEGEGWLYLNSLADEEAETSSEDGVVYSTRAVFLDGLHDYVHDILLINMGTEGISSLSAELVSDEVELDEYWTLKGKYELAGFVTEYEYSYHDLANMAKIRIKAKEAVEAGKDISGTLTIKSGSTVLMVLTLTGTVGDPSIITDDIPQAVKYVPYGTMIQNSNKYSWNEPSYSLANGKLPAGMVLKPNGELYGVPTETGEFTFTVRLKNNVNSLASSNKTFTLTVNENTDENVEGATDQGYNLTQRVQNITLSSNADQTLVSQGVFSEFVDIFLDGVKLQRGVDYTAESGSTRIVIRSQTLKASNKTGTHTLGIEFRTNDTNDLKRAAQNYNVGAKNSSNHSSSGGSGSNSSTTKTTGSSDAKRGFMNAQAGIITGQGAGYSRWQQDENGWRLIYADGTAAAGNMVTQPDGTAAEQVLWEKVNGFYYTFGADGYLKSGWIFDYQLNSWYYVTVETGMVSGWYKEPQDGCFYYLDPANGQIVTGWKQIDENWYYFTEQSLEPTWILDEDTGKWTYDENSKNKPFGSMYHDERTPDGYYVASDGSWDGKDK